MSSGFSQAIVTVTVSLFQRVLFAAVIIGGLLGSRPTFATDAKARVEPPECTHGVNCRVRPQDEVWFISSRHLGCPNCARERAPNLEVRAYECGQGWVRSDLEVFLADDPLAKPKVTVFWIHGNQVGRGQSFTDGWRAYRTMTCRADARPIRFVIWSWPSDKIPGPLKDARAKAARSDTDSYYLGWTLSRMAPRIPVSLIGHSYGARIILGGLHLSTGASMCGRSLDLIPGQAISRTRVVLVAAAVHSNWMMPGSRYGDAYVRINAMLNLFNSCDSVLKFYRFVDPNGRPRAMGYAGIAGRSRLEDGGERIRQMNACGAIGKSHDDADYFRSSYLMNSARRYLLWSAID